MVISSDLKRQWLDMTTAVGLARDFVARFNEPGYCPFTAAALHKPGAVAVPVAVPVDEAKREHRRLLQRASEKRRRAAKKAEKANAT